MMEHKAFLFDYDAFAERLKPALERALMTGDTTGLVAFISENRGSLRDPAEGTPLADDWPSSIEPQDAHQYGDLALTLFYDPREDFGLGNLWQSAQAILSREIEGDQSPILGHPVDAFDPGKMGSYFQSAEDVRANLRRLEEVAAQQPGLRSALGPSMEMLARAARAGKGLYVTF